MTKKIKPGYLLGVILIFVLVAVSFSLLQSFSVQIKEALGSSNLSGLSGDELTQAKALATGKALGIISVIPVVMTVVLAFLTREVVPSLFAGIISGFIILEGTGGTGGFFTKIGGVFASACGSIVNTATDSFHAAILILCLCIGGMVSVINVSGGFGALGKKLTRGINSPKRATIMAQAMGMSLFFDDYANSLITGPVMKHITDKQGVSREKLAYIVDSTAAPVAGIAIISSWIAAELSAIDSGFAIAGVEGSAYGSFLGSIPFCFYNFVAIAIVFATALMGREYGPMLAAERRARAGEPLKGGDSAPDDNSTEAVVEAGSIWSAILPVATMIICSFAGFYLSGISNAAEAGIINFGTGFSFSLVPVAFENADTVNVLMQAAVLSSLVAMFMGCFTGKTTMSQAISAWLKGASGILLTAVILVLAWTLSSVIAQLGTAYYFAELVTVSLPYWMLPMLIFITCCIISFAAGSFGCMVLLMPIAIPIAYQASSFATGYAPQFVFACIAAVLSGSIFGDHCSPVTDTTILSSLGAGCDNLDHVKTQLPYALTVAGIASVVGYLPAGLGISPLFSVPAGIIIAVLIIRFAGKKVEASAEKTLAAEMQ